MHYNNYVLHALSYILFMYVYRKFDERHLVYVCMCISVRMRYPSLQDFSFCRHYSCQRIGAASVLVNINETTNLHYVLLCQLQYVIEQTIRTMATLFETRDAPFEDERANRARRKPIPNKLCRLCCPIYYTFTSNELRARFARSTNAHTRSTFRASHCTYILHIQ